MSLKKTKKKQDGFNDTNHINQGIGTNGGSLFSWIKRGISPLSCQLPFLPPGGKGLKLKSIIGPSWCLITSGLIPEPNGGRKQTNHNSQPVETSLGYLKAYHGPAWRANQPSSSRRDVKKVEQRKCDTKMLKVKDLRTQLANPSFARSWS